MGTERESESISRIGIGTDKIQTIPNPSKNVKNQRNHNHSNAIRATACMTVVIALTVRGIFEQIFSLLQTSL